MGSQRKLRTTGTVWILAAVILCIAYAKPKEKGHHVSFKKIVIDKEYRSEGATVVDVNRDGKLDIMAGNLWYEAPNWTPHEIAPVKNFDPATQYSNSFFNFTPDVDKDGWPDQIVFGLPKKPVVWRRNPQGKPGHWKEYALAPEAWTESPAFPVLFAGRPPVLLFTTGQSEMAWVEPAADVTLPWLRHSFTDPSPNAMTIPGHGLGVGDINGDGKPEVITTKGYWEIPSDPKTVPWRFVPAALGPDCAQMIVYDVNGDGLPDVITSSAHKVGLWWFEQKRGARGPEFIQHTIDESFSQSHALELADINGDGLMDIVTGKRFWAHGPSHDVQPNDPCVLYWFELRRDDGQVQWIKHEIDNDSGVGTQFTIADINGDKLPDLIVSNKKGVFLFVQERPRPGSR